MTDTMDILLEARQALNEALTKNQTAINQLAIAAERWAETRPDRLSTQLRAYRETKQAVATAVADVFDAEKAAIAARDICGECGWLCNEGHEEQCESSPGFGERPVPGSSIAREARNWVDDAMASCGLVRS